MEFTHERFGKCVIAEITQKQLADYSKEMQALGNETMIVFRGESVKAAVKHGLLLEPKLTASEVDNANPGLVRWLSDMCISKAITEATNIDPLS